MMIKTILFDYGGVLGNDSNAWDKEFVAVKSLSGLSSKKLNQIFDSFWPKLKLGKITVNTFWDQVYQSSINYPQPGSLEKAYQSGISINQKLLNLAKALKSQNFHPAILSNETKDWMQQKIDKFHLDSLFKPIYCSAFLGFSKPDKKIFKFVLQDLKLKPAETLLIDNQLNNINIAQPLGFNTIHYQTPDQLITNLTRQIPSLKLP